MSRESKQEEGTEQAAGDSHSSGRGDCLEAEFHLVIRKKGRLNDVALLAKSCNIAADYPEPGDAVEVNEKEKLIVHGFGGGAGLWGDTDMSVGFDPLRRVKITTSSFHRAELDDETGHTWNWDTFEGTAYWGALDCKAKRAAQADRAHNGSKQIAEEPASDPRLRVNATLIPALDLPADFVADGWRKASLGACSAPLTFTIHGKSDSPDDVSARALVANRTLFVEVSDDRFVGPGKRWINDDHLELWIGDYDQSEDECDGDTNAGKMVQWGIRVTDGAVFPAHGDPAPLVGVEREVSQTKARFKIPLSEAYKHGHRLTIVYSDSDDGRRQEQLIASSELRFGNPSTLGDAFAVSETDAICVAEKGALRIKRVPLQPMETPITQDRGWW